MSAASYRIQFNPDFRLEDARAKVPYLSRLGITHLYASPILRAREGSQHGYDVVDPTTVSPDLGDETDLRELSRALRAHGMNLILDIVPNHMATSSENPYWMDILTYGVCSRYNHWFDIDWRLPDPDQWGRVFLPILGVTIGRAISMGQIQIKWEEGRFLLYYYDHKLPLDPATIPAIFKASWDELQDAIPQERSSYKEMKQLLKNLSKLPKRATRVRRRDAMPSIEEIEDWLAQLARIIESSPQSHDWAVGAATHFSEGSEGQVRLRKLLDAQNYQLSHWRQAARAINYRRFFDINDLISVRQEDPQVFEETHAAIRRWVQDGLVDGLRIDHIDGLRDPQGYLSRLQGLASERPSTERPFLIFAEKILAPHEVLPEGWECDGTTGYEFLNEVESIFLHPEGVDEIEENYHTLVGKSTRFRRFAYRGKRRILENDLAASLGSLRETLVRIARQSPDTEQFENSDLETVLKEIIVGLPVYRTYLRAETPELVPADREHLRDAIRYARRAELENPEALDFVRSLLLLEDAEQLNASALQERLNFIERMQQLSGPAAAKGIEDTALYIYVPLASRNEVGGEPDYPLGDACDRLHHENKHRAAEFPRNMLCVTTHDTKRSADVRARLDVLSEVPVTWREQVQNWRKLNSSKRYQGKGKPPVPDPNTEYLFYQTLVACWPEGDLSLPDEETMPDKEQLMDLAVRLEEYMLKAAREAKERTNWVKRSHAFEDGLSSFVNWTLTNPKREPTFLNQVHSFARRLARPGYWNSLARTVIHLTSPGSPDVYQGDEMWNFSLVDPDNRRPVDFDLRQVLLDQVLVEAENKNRKFLAGLVDTPEDGRIKLHVVRTLLAARREWPDIFESQSYERIPVTGSYQKHVFAFGRVGEFGSGVVVIVPRLTHYLLEDRFPAPVGPKVWSDTALELPKSFRRRNWRSIIARPWEQRGEFRNKRSLDVADVLDVFPVEVLIAE